MGKLQTTTQQIKNSPGTSLLLPVEYHGLLQPVVKASRFSPTESYLLSLGSEESRRTMKSHFNKVAGMFGINSHKDFAWELLTRDVVNYILGQLAEQAYAPATINTLLVAIKKATEFAYDHDLMTHKEYDRIRRIKRIRGKREERREELEKVEIESFIQACNDGSLKGLRDLTLFLTIIGCGLRRAESVSIKLKNVDLEKRTLRVIGKGNKQRKVGIPQMTCDALKHYINEAHDPNNGEAYLFSRFFKNDEPQGFGKDDGITYKMGTSSVNYVFEQRGLDCKIQRFKPHDLRRTFATKMLRDGKSMEHVQFLLGHESIVTTQHYDLRGEKEAIAAAQEHKIL
jgi:integrase/recombinase XerD